MTTFLLATDAVHATASACDYLAGRLDAADTVMVLGVADGDVSERDLDDASNVARARLAPATVWTERREGDPADAIRAVSAEIEADEIVVVAGHGSELGSTARAVAAGADRPVVLVPPSEGEPFNTGGV